MILEPSTKQLGVTPNDRDEQKRKNRNSLAVQQLGLLALTAEGPGSIPSQGTKIPQAVRCSQFLFFFKENIQWFT